MMKPKLYIPLLVSTLGLGNVAVAGAVDELFAEYKQSGAASFSATTGEQLWKKTYKSDEGGPDRSCETCHTPNLKNTGKHAKTGKAIDPLSPKVNSERLADVKKIEKWFKRNCKWTLGRECTPQEKGDFLAYIRTQ